MDYELMEDPRSPGEWRVEGFGQEGEPYITIFVGAAAETRAREYLAWLKSDPLREG